MTRDARHSTARSSRRAHFAVSRLALAVALLAAIPVQSQESDFDHTATRFLLTGSHEGLRCEACHSEGIFRGTPTDCAFCHDATGMRAESGKPTDHVPTSNRCADCHTTVTWEEVRFDHSAVSGSCSGCHNGVMARGKPPDHISTNADCGLCHIDVTWNAIRFDHSAVTGACSSCHNGVESTGKPNDHVMTTAECDTCHSTRAWSPAGFDHSGITTACSSCHDGVQATGKDANHIQTTADCSACHSTNAWSPADFDHSTVTGPCSSCHNGVTATGKPGDHFVTSSECDVCHATNQWMPSTFRHISASYPGDHRGNLGCTECHMANSETVQWPYSTLQPDCAGCHQGDFKSGPHKKHENPDVTYTAEELRDCSGACHTYTDATLTTIKDFRSGKHRVNDSSF